MESRPVRLGWLSLLLTVIILCLATLSVLSFSTARADLALAQKQARQAQSVYALECAGQQWLAELVAALAQAGGTDMGERLAQMLARKARTVKSATPYDLKTKLIRYGLSLGYEYEAVIEAASAMVRETDTCEDF